MMILYYSDQGCAVQYQQKVIYKREYHQSEQEAPMQWHYYRNVTYLISHFKAFTKPIGYPTVYTYTAVHKHTWVITTTCTYFPQKLTLSHIIQRRDMWCHDGHGLSP